MAFMNHGIDQSKRNKRRYATYSWPLIAGVLTAGLFFRFYNLEKKVYWYDETFTSLYISGYMPAEVQQIVGDKEIGVDELTRFQRVNLDRGLLSTITALSMNIPHHSPLYYGLARLWAGLFGDSVWVIRSLSAFAKSVGAKQIVASNLTLIIDPRLSSGAIFNDRGRMHYYRVALEEIQDSAAREHIVFDYHGPGLDDASVSCRENIRHACVISVRGDVVPCVFANPVLCENQQPGKGPCYTFRADCVPLRGMPSGNIRNETLTRIWNKKEYHRFRDLFDPAIPRKPEQILLEMPGACV